MKKRGLAIHWQILIGLGLGIIAGLVLNVVWDGETWSAIGVTDHAAWLEGKSNQLKEPEKASVDVAARWALASLTDNWGGAGTAREPDVSSLAKDEVTDEMARDRVRLAAAWMFSGTLPPPSHAAPEPPSEELIAAFDDWLRTEVQATLAAKKPRKFASPPESGNIGTLIEPFVRTLDDLIVEDVHPNAEAGLPAAAARFVRNLNDFIGTLFIRCLRFVAVPIVLFSLIVGASSLNDLKKMSRIGGKTIGLYLCTTAVAITVGLVFANVARPGERISPELRDDIALSQAEAAQVKVGQAQEKPSTWDTFLNAVPENPFAALAGAEMLQVVITALVIGMALTLIPKEKARPVIAFCDGMTDVIIKIVEVLMLVAPYAVFALIVKMIAEMGLELLGSLIVYGATVITGLLIMILIVYPAVLKAFTPVGYRRFFRSLAPAQLLAFSSSSSAATLPVTMECCEKRLGVSDDVSSFVLPLGATINMDGTALLQGVAAIFIAQLFNLPLTIGDQLTIVLTATLASIGTAAVPSAGIIMLVIVLQSIRIPEEAMVTGIAVIFSVDRILDMSRTVCNITGDSMVATVVAATEKELLSEEEVERRLEREAEVGLDEHPFEGTGDEYANEK